MSRWMFFPLLKKDYLHSSITISSSPKTELLRLILSYFKSLIKLLSFSPLFLIFISIII